MHDTHNHYYGDPAIEQKLDRILQLLEKEESTMAILDQLTTDVTANTSVVNSTVQLVSNIVAQLKALQAQGPVDAGALSQLTTQLESNNAALAAAVAANTPAAPAPNPAPQAAANTGAQISTQGSPGTPVSATGSGTAGTIA